MGKGKRVSAYLYRDRRRRLRRLRLLQWTAVLLAALLLLILLISLLTKRPERPAPPEPSPAPTASAAPTVEPAPEITPEPTAEPAGGVEPPQADIATKEELIALYWWMIENGADNVSLRSLGVGQGEIADITDKFSNYFSKYRSYTDPPSVRVELKPGVAALHALQSGDTGALTDEARFVAEQARAEGEQHAAGHGEGDDRERAVALRRQPAHEALGRRAEVHGLLPDHAAAHRTATRTAHG